MEAEQVDRYVFLGDIVGYGASPNAVIEAIRDLRPFSGIRGNHDKVATEVDDGDNFRGYAKQAALWTRERLSIANRGFLNKLPQGPHQIDDDLLISHGSPQDEDFYILTETDAISVLTSVQGWLTFFGHTHVPFIGYLSDESQLESDVPAEARDFTLQRSRRYLINPGSVGQPRDHNPDASFTILDTEDSVLSFRRIPYNIQKAQEKILAAGLDPFLAERLSKGR